MFRSRLFSGFAAGAAVAAAGSLTALAGTANAQTTVPGWPFAYGGGASTTATGTGAATTWTLRTGSQGQEAGLYVSHPADELEPWGMLSPGTAPTFTVTSANATPNTGPETANPRWVIELSNDCRLEGGTAGGGQTVGNNGQWIAVNWGRQGQPSTGPTTWSAALTAAGGTSNNSSIGCAHESGKGGIFPYWARVIASGRASTTYTLTHVTFAGRPVIDAHTLPAFTETRTGRIRNFATGKCLDVTGGRFTGGTPLQQWTCGARGSGVAGGNQNFRIVDELGGTSFLQARTPSGQIWYVTVDGSGERLTLTNRYANPMNKQGPFYTFPEAGFSGNNRVDLDMSAFGSGNGSHVIGLPRVPDNAQRWTLP